jgi:hypothetical protein
MERLGPHAVHQRESSRSLRGGRKENILHTAPAKFGDQVEAHTFKSHARNRFNASTWPCGRFRGVQQAQDEVRSRRRLLVLREQALLQ